jgi:glycosyltransferase involved in cell wall biosynthesis
VASYVIITGEYPPQRGGVADYTHLVARELIESGEQVEVWAPRAGEFPVAASTVPRVCRVSGRFNPLDLVVLDRMLEKHRPDRVLIQYVPHAFGFKAMNLPFCLWVMKAARRHAVWIMFHEVAFPISRRQPIRHNTLGVVNRVMARILSHSAKRIFVSTPSWRTLLKTVAPSAVEAEWLPVPSNVRRCSSRCGCAHIEVPFFSALTVIGHFGTYGPAISRTLRAVVPEVLESIPGSCLMAMGNKSPAFAKSLIDQMPELRSRVYATGFVEEHALSHYLRSCDVMFQPYPDGVSGRRTSVMAALAHAISVVTTTGRLTEDIWMTSKAVAIADAHDAEALADQLRKLVLDRTERTHLSERGYSLYCNRFHIRHTINALRN